MNIMLNNQPLTLPAQVLTIQDFMEWKKLNPVGTAVAVNGQLVLRDRWSLMRLQEMDRLSVISAAFGG